MEDVLVMLIPVIGVSIPLVVVAGRFVVQPIVNAVVKHSEARNAPVDPALVGQRMDAIEERLAQIERSMDRLVEEQAFHRQLASGRSGRGTGTESGRP